MTNVYMETPPKVDAGCQLNEMAFLSVNAGSPGDNRP